MTRIDPESARIDHYTVSQRHTPETYTHKFSGFYDWTGESVSFCPEIGTLSGFEGLSRIQQVQSMAMRPDTGFDVLIV